MNTIEWTRIIDGIMIFVGIFIIYRVSDYIIWFIKWIVKRLIYITIILVIGVLILKFGIAPIVASFR